MHQRASEVIHRDRRPEIVAAGPARFVEANLSVGAVDADVVALEEAGADDAVVADSGRIGDEVVVHDDTVPRPGIRATEEDVRSPHEPGRLASASALHARPSDARQVEAACHAPRESVRVRAGVEDEAKGSAPGPALDGEPAVAKGERDDGNERFVGRGAVRGFLHLRPLLDGSPPRRRRGGRRGGDHESDSDQE